MILLAPCLHKSIIYKSWVMDRGELLHMVQNRQNQVGKRSPGPQTNDPVPSERLCQCSQLPQWIFQSHRQPITVKARKQMAFHSSGHGELSPRSQQGLSISHYQLWGCVFSAVSQQGAPVKLTSNFLYIHRT